MLSSIKVDFKSTPTGLQPAIFIKMQDSEDPRDGLLKAFFQALKHQSSWLTASFDHHVVNGSNDAITYITLHPVTPEDFPATIEYIQQRMQHATEPYSGTSNCSPIAEHKPSDR